MTNAQRVFGGFVLLAVAYSALHYYLFEAVVWGLGSDGVVGAVESGLVDAAYRLPYVLTPYLILQSLVLGFWTIRPPGLVSRSNLKVTVVRLSEWLRWSALLLILVGIGIAVAFVARQMLAVYFMTLVPFFGIAYSTSVYRCLQLNRHLEAQGVSGFSTRTLALGAWLPSMLGLLFPLGLCVPVAVWHRARGLRLEP